MQRSTSMTLACFAVTLVPSIVMGDVVNGDFETGDFAGWDTFGDVGLIDSGFAAFIPPFDGGDNEVLMIAFLDEFGSGVGASSLSQDFSAVAGDVLSIDFSGTGLHHVLHTSGNFFEQFPATLEPAGPWTRASWVIPEAGDYVIFMEVFALGADSFDSAIVDNVGLNIVPEPSTFVLGVLSLIALLAYGWRRPTAQC